MSESWRRRRKEVARSLLRNLLGGVTARVTFDDYVDVLVLLATKLASAGTLRSPRASTR